MYFEPFPICLSYYTYFWGMFFVLFLALVSQGCIFPISSDYLLGGVKVGPIARDIVDCIWYKCLQLTMASFKTNSKHSSYILYFIFFLPRFIALYLKKLLNSAMLRMYHFKYAIILCMYLSGKHIILKKREF